MNPAKLLRNNRILHCGLLTASCAAIAVSLRNALVLCLVAGIVWFLSAVGAALIPAKLPASLRAVLYSEIAGLVYIPTGIAAAYFAPQLAESIYLPLCCAFLCFTAGNIQILPQPMTLKALLFEIGSCCAVILLSGLLREMLGSGTILSITLTEHPPLPFLLTAPGGVILLVLFGAALESLAARGEQKEAQS
ncbi:MAG: hypothetical protein IKQ91_00495 [Oscillospiraceae bacterium]|nr:hypothetical protein [Oscillospiraceae bacterium]